jgi:hypothetical protein
VLFEAIIAVPALGATISLPCQRHQQRDGHYEQHCFGIRHQPHGAALELSTLYSSPPLSPSPDGLLRRDIAKEAALRRLGNR